MLGFRHRYRPVHFQLLQDRALVPLRIATLSQFHQLCLQRHQPIAFLAKSTFFKSPVLGAIMRSGNCIPIYRRQDAEGGAEALTPAQLTASNEASAVRA